MSTQQAHERFGDVLFGSARKLPEDDTPEEAELSNRMRQWYWGSLGSIRPSDTETLMSLSDTGLYDDVLAPEIGKIAYRNAAMSWDQAKQLLMPGKVIETYEYRGWSDDEKPITTGYAYDMGPQVLSLQAGSDRENVPARSWSSERAAFVRLMKRWTGEDVMRRPSPGRECLVYFIANIDDNRDSFLFNHNGTRKLAGRFAGQKEVIQVGPVQISGGVICRFTGDYTDLHSDQAQTMAKDSVRTFMKKSRG
tara:strand:- start:50 stop:802 length:753 start_codon:yes stop_codon:yes gene_type:complete